jgi:uncharacterized protein
MQIKAVFHIDEVEKWKLLIGNVKNLVKALADNQFEIEIVANSVAVTEYKMKSSVFSNEFDELSKIGIRLCACGNALNGLEIKPEEIFDFVEVVPAGVKEIIEKQLVGFAYVKP